MSLIGSLRVLDKALEDVIEAMQANKTHDLFEMVSFLIMESELLIILERVADALRCHEYQQR